MTLVQTSSAIFCLAVMLTLSGCGGGSVPEPRTPTAGPEDARAEDLLKQMTIDEKIQLVHGGSIRNLGIQISRGAGSRIPGIPRLGIPDLYFAGGSVGVSAGVGEATALPSSIANAATWDLKEAANYGQIIGSESSAYGINVNLGGDVNLTGREPRDGRTFETKGEDPVLAGKMAAAQLTAIRAQFVMAGIKHFSFNDQETGRLTADVHIDERSARETDLLAFEIAIKESGVQSLMCAYNQVNENFSCENSYLLNQVLKGDWAFPGYVLSDFGATHSTINAANNGLDQEQPDHRYFGNLLVAVTLGLVHQSRLDDMVHRILRAMIADGLLDHPQTIQPIDVAAGGAIAQEVEEQGAVLLKNNGVLPLSTRVPSIAVIGSHADVAVISGGGSSAVDPVGGSPVPATVPCPPCSSAVVWVPSSPLKAIQAAAPATVVKFDDGTNIASAAALAASSSVAIVFVNQWASEGMDLPSLNFTDLAAVTPIDQDVLVGAVAVANPNTIVVMENGGPQVIPWAANVAAVLEAWYPGQSGGPAIANLLFGMVNPSGKLPMTFPVTTNQLPRPVIDKPPTPGAQFKIDYSIDGYNVGYKWFDAQGITPAFPFGFGLSYTTFAISNPQLTATTSGTSQGFSVTFDLANTGSVDGAEVAQVYLLPPASTGEQRRLVGWQKTTLLPAQQQRITIEVNAGDPSHPLAYWDTKAHAWTISSGTYTVYLGNSSRNLTTVGTFEIP